MRADLLERYQALPLPTTTDEHWRFTDLRGFDPETFTVNGATSVERASGMLDVDAAAINTNYATQAGLDPVKDPILREDPKGPYVNLIAVRAADKDKPWVKILVDSYHTPEVKEFVLTKFKGAVLPSW